MPPVSYSYIITADIITPATDINLLYSPTSTMKISYLPTQVLLQYLIV